MRMMLILMMMMSLILIMVMNSNSSSNINKEALASAAARGVSSIFWRVFGLKPETLEFCVVFVKKTMFRSCFPKFFGLVFW